jgi:putative peptidoglycan lipid II flippase
VTLSRALRLILYLTIPATVGLVILAKPITAFLLRSGSFDQASTDLVVSALVFYALALFAHSGIEILSRGYYALSDTRTPVAFAVISMIVNLVLSPVLVWQFGIRGLALSLSIATVIEFVLLLRTLVRRLHGFDGAHVMRSVSSTLAGSVVMGEVLLLWLALLRFAGLLDLDIKLEAAFAVGGGTALGALAFFFATRALRSEEAQVLIERLPLPAQLRALIGA